MEIQKVNNLFTKTSQAEDTEDVDETEEIDDTASETDETAEQTTAAAIQQQGDTVEVSKNEVTSDTVQSIMTAKVAELKAKIDDPKINSELTKLLGNFDSEKFMKDYGSQIQTTAEATALLYYLYFDKYEEIDGQQKKQ